MTFKDLTAGSTEADILGELLDGESDALPEVDAEPEPEVRHLASGASEFTLCGIERGEVSAVHPSKARKNDCAKCRERWRELKGKKPPSPAGITFKEQSAPSAPVPPAFCGKCGSDTDLEIGPNGTLCKKCVEPVPVPTPQPAPTPAPKSKRVQSPESAAIDAKVRELRATIKDNGDPMSHIDIETFMGWPAQHGNRSWRICKRLGIK